MMMSLEGKIVLITGAASGIGLAVAKQLLSQQAHVIAIDYNDDDLHTLSNYAEEQNLSLTAVQLDITNEQKIKELSIIIEERFAKIDVLIANAAILGDVTPLDHYDSQLWQKVISTNATANFWLIKYFNQLLLKSTEPQVIFVACQMSKKNYAYWGAYLVSKMALLTLAKIYIEENNNTLIKINIIDPGVTHTSLRTQGFPKEDNSNLQTTEQASKIFLYCLVHKQIEHGKILCYNAEKEIVVSDKFEPN